MRGIHWTVQIREAMYPIYFYTVGFDHWLISVISLSYLFRDLYIYYLWAFWDAWCKGALRFHFHITEFRYISRMLIRVVTLQLVIEINPATQYLRHLSPEWLYQLACFVSEIVSTLIWLEMRGKVTILITNQLIYMTYMGPMKIWQ